MNPSDRTAARVLMTADAIGGVWTYALDVASGLSGQGVETALAVLGPAPAPAQRAAASAVKGLRLVETGLPLDWLAEPEAIRQSGCVVRDLAAELDVDIVHLNAPALAAAGDWARPVVGAVHSCLATWWRAAGEGPMPAEFQRRTEALRRGLNACDLLIAPTAAYAAEVAEVYGVAPPLVVHNGRRTLGAVASGRRRRVLTAGRLWDRGKNVGVVDEAAGLIDATVEAAGPTAGPSGERATLAHVSALGSLTTEDLRRRLATTAVFVSVPLYEPFGLSVLEAAQAGCALVLSDIETLRELWDGAAVFAPAHDAVAVAEALQALLDDAEAAERLGNAARARARRYSLAAMTAGVLAAYGRLGPALAAEAAA